MREIIVVSSGILVEVIKALLVYWGFFKMNFTKKWYRYAAAAALFVTVIGGIYFFDAADKLIVFSTFLRLGYLLIIVEGKPRTKILRFLPAYVGIYLADILVSVAIAFVLQEDLLYVWQNENAVTAGNLITILIFGLVGIFRRRDYKSADDFERRLPLYYYIVPAIGILGMVLMGGVQWSLVMEDVSDSRLIIIIATVLVCLFLFVLSFGLIRIWDQKNYYMSINQLNDALLQTQKQYYKDLYDSNQDIRRFKHDYSAHMRSLKNLSEAGEQEKLHKYIEDLAGTSFQSTRTIHTGNYMVDAIINEMANRAGSHIRFECCGVLPEDFSISEMDLCTIFSNALNNAIEACSKLEDGIEKVIEVELKNYRNFVYISIENPVPADLNIVNGKMPTDKKDKTRHGFGMANMKNAVEKNGGEIEWTQTGGKCRVNICFE
ncbi:sensor histidine kinase [Anaerobium acetethylicum]|uniref:GHKL domain-containing protein n=1 Tax=Anaerobium acetethylicum TaxID=1619234 RepID=A0A1D3TXU3_9FIRM|nr:GHKL domain-containing protein [Anaerobium acetethylicum]SCP99194.1 GHKL domain-containing protein [Anaerobium acetethylicum]